MPENSDTSFSWKDFFEKNNSLLVGHFGNYIHRTLSLYKGENIGSKVSETIINQCEVALKTQKSLSKNPNLKIIILKLSLWQNTQINTLINVNRG